MNKVADLASPGLVRRGNRICALRYRSQERVNFAIARLVGFGSASPPLPRSVDGEKCQGAVIEIPLIRGAARDGALHRR